MKLHEYQAKSLLQQYGVPVPGGEVADNFDDALKIANDLGGRVVVKAQVLMGGRGKAGGVKLFNSALDAAEFTRELIGKRLKSIQNPVGMVVERVLIAEQLDFQEEYYVSVLLDRAAQKNLIMISKEGGVEIEQVAEKDPDSIIKLHIDPKWGVYDFQIRKAVARAGIAPHIQNKMVAMVKSLVKAYMESDAEMIEINPCALTTDGRLIAADAKVSIDDNALFRHKALQGTAAESAEHPLEAEAAKYGIAYVHLGGDIGIMGNGAGLVMCTLDEVSAAGGRPANFLDVGGGAQAERVKTCVELILKDPNVKGLLINIFGGITRGDEVAKGILAAFEQMNVDLPVVARVEGTGADEAIAILKDSQIVPASTMQEAAEKIVQLAYRN